MPSEERFITFSLDEIYKALSICAIQRDLKPLPKGELVSLKISDEPNDSDTIFVDLKNKQETISISFERTFFAIALVFYCQGSGIPLPKNGQKILNIMDDKIIMKIVLA